MIPKIILQTSKEELPTYLTDHWKSILDSNWKYVWMDDKKIFNFFKQNYLKEIPNPIDKFKSFLHGAHKADFFRYYYIYVNGGIFVDSDAMIKEEFFTLDFENLNGFASFAPNGFLHPYDSMYNGFIGFEPKSLIIFDCLKHIYGIDLNYINVPLTMDPKTLEIYHTFVQYLYKSFQKHKPSNFLVLTNELVGHDWTGGINICYNNKVICNHYPAKDIYEQERL